MPVYRYRFDLPGSSNAALLAKFLPDLPSAIGNSSPSTFIDVTVADTSKPDLDDIMGTRGFSFVEQDPVTTTVQAAQTANSIIQLTAVVPTTIAPDDVAAAGVGTTSARSDHRHAIVTDVVGATGYANSEGVANAFARADHTHAFAPTLSQATATADTTTTSGTDVLMASMTLTPGAGSYLIMASTTLRGSSSDSTIFTSLYVGGVQLAYTERMVFQDASTVPSDTPVAMQAYVTGVTGGQAIEVRWRRSAGTATAHERTLTLMRVA